jgi:hypothetical protein
VKAEIAKHWRYWLVVLAHIFTVGVFTDRAFTDRSPGVGSLWWIAVAAMTFALGLHAATGRRRW